MLSTKERLTSYIDGAHAKINVKLTKVLVLGILAGMFIAFASVAHSFSNALLENGRLFGALVFPFGLMMVVISGSELFTGDCLLIAPLLDKKISFKRFSLFMVLVYFANFIGAILVALAVVYSGSLSLIATNVVQTAVTKSTLGFGFAFLKGVLCNFLVCIAVWMAISSKSLTGKALACVPGVFLFVFCGFEHSVANMYYLFAGLFANGFYSVGNADLTFVNLLFGNLLPVTLGNVLGGSLVGVAYYFVVKD